MKKYVIALMCLFSVSAFAETYKGYPDIPGTAVGFATEVVSYTPGPKVSSSFKDPKRALGAPNIYSSGETTFSLGAAGSLVLRFSPLAIKKGGTVDADFYVYEVGIYESWDAYVSVDGNEWIKATPVFKDINPAPSNVATNRGSVIGYDVDVIESTSDSFAYLKIVDTSLSTYADSPGADIDAVVVTSAKVLGSEVFVDTDSRNGTIYNLYQNDVTGAVGVKIINKDNVVSYVPFSTDDSLKAVALSLQGDFNCDDEKDINVLATKTADNVQVNIIKQQNGTAIKTIDNSITK
ncbi:cell envelope biogenesis protein OmpA [Pectobacterium odoriferum]|uniref:Cell envelope biogenesis protein OmpA n=1 Tax=Pectobacterium odoriferum TaxID=78398 RepID=A0ABD6VJN8_9GAMM|nr:cell envelope biogenesis protein OmpA [Pectobacterium odoriferum]AIU88086.1 cell envelope biogenesis protein OmpA [Pectobacterium odoriferum]POD93748.1 cell envelope biogenesis protein OmpA [Pectobacterium odoriferum]POE01622.1 cell envelope biogenesis protein OmpA [Pectobacterium odoriferum]POE05733.1 cell envelope biogenesis protein OmpA [Pectobacterium odoriferum]POE07844.1 cell envelope biogenesis protein OmpA [Pectobacterium odoriferum]